MKRIVFLAILFCVAFCNASAQSQTVASTNPSPGEGVLSVLKRMLPTTSFSKLFTNTKQSGWADSDAWIYPSDEFQVQVNGSDTNIVIVRKGVQKNVFAFSGISATVPAQTVSTLPMPATTNLQRGLLVSSPSGQQALDIDFDANNNGVIDEPEMVAFSNFIHGENIAWNEVAEVLGVNPDSVQAVTVRSCMPVSFNMVGDTTLPGTVTITESSPLFAAPHIVKQIGTNIRYCLARGDTGAPVTELQLLLRLLFADTPVDGVYGEATVAAVYKLQQQYHLYKDGKAGPQVFRLFGLGPFRDPYHGSYSFYIPPERSAPAPTSRTELSVSVLVREYGPQILMGDSVHQRIVVKACELNAQARIPLIDKVKSKSVTLTFGYLPDGEPTVLFTPNAYGQEKDSPILATGYALVVGGDHQIIYRE